MPADSPIDRLERAIESTNPSAAAQEVARSLRDEGTSPADLLNLLDAFRERHELDADESRYEAVLDAMDLVEAWSGPDGELYPDS